MFRTLTVLAILSIPLAAADGLVGRWVLDRAAVSDAKLKPFSGEWTGDVAGTVRFSENPPALVLDGKTNFIRLAGTMDVTRLPAAALTAETWVAPSAGGAWGATIGCVQDNVEFERGWLLGYKDSKWCFAVGTGKKMTYLAGPEEMRLDRWAHVAGTYDGTVMRLYVDGREVGTSTLQNGPIAYAPAPFVLGAYQDADEFYPFDGLLREAALWNRALPAEEIARHFAEGRRQFPPGMNAAPLPLVGPYVRFMGPDSALVQWETESESAGVVEFGETKALGSRAVEPKAVIEHAVELRGLKLHASYFYRLHFAKGSGGEAVSALFQLETDFNFTKPPLPDVRPFGDDATAVALAERVLAETKTSKGCALVLGDDGRVAWEIARRSALSVVSANEDASAVARGRTALDAAGVYGQRVQVLHSPDGKLPFVDGMFDLVLVAAVPEKFTELARVLRPAGAAWFGNATPDDVIAEQLNEDHAPAGRIRLSRTDPDEQPSVQYVRAIPPEIGAWSHAYGDAGQSANSGDKTVHGRSLELQWFGEPGARGMMDRQPRSPPPLCVNGTFFIQGNDRLCALDAWNGAVLWTLEVPGLRRVNLPRDTSNMCADEGFLYAAVRDRALRIAARTGEVAASFPIPAGSHPEPREWGYIAVVGDQLFGSAVRPASAYTRFEGGGDYWYDSHTADSTAKIVSDALFSIAPGTRAVMWRYEPRGLVINSTISIGGGRVYFLESRNPPLANEPGGRIASAALYRDIWLVALDAGSGKLAWEKKIELPAATVPAALYVCYSDEKLVLLDSESKTYHTFAFSAKDGAELWRRSHPWRRDHHGGHLYHPVMVRGMVIVEPIAYDLATGAVKLSNLPERGGCSTLSAAADCLHYINWDYDKGSMYVWDLDDDRARQFSGSRGNCWLSFISGSGMVLLPAASGGCTCRYPNQVTLGLVPREK